MDAPWSHIVPAICTDERGLGLDPFTGLEAFAWHGKG